MYKYTELKKEDLQPYLEEIRRIASLEDEVALVELDKFLFDIVSPEETDDIVDENKEVEVFEAYPVEFFIEDFKDQIKEDKKAIKRNAVSKDDITYLQSCMDEVEEFKEKNPERITELDRLYNDAQPVLHELTFTKHSNDISQSLLKEFADIRAVRRTIKELNEAEIALSKISKLTEELKMDVFKGKVRCCRFRANKILNEAEIAYKTNNINRSTKLKIKAQALFEQDWKEYFNNDSFYQIT